MPDFTRMLSKKFKNSKDFCQALLNESGVAVLPGSDFGFPVEKLIFRLSFVDFNGAEFLKVNNSDITEESLPKYAPKIVDGIQQIIRFAKKHN